MTFEVVLLSSYRNWIMEAIPREAASAVSQKVSLRYLPISRKAKLAPSVILSRFHFGSIRNRLYMNHVTFLMDSKADKSNSRVFITHFEQDQTFSGFELEKLRKVQQFFVQNASIKQEMVKMGFNSNIIEVVYGAVSSSYFYPLSDVSEIVRNQILIVGDCKPRKNPHLIEKTIRNSPEYQFVIHGKDWDKFTNLAINPPTNLKIQSFKLNMHPKLVRESSLLLTLASNEGGPFPILEALSSGTPVVATNTGFAPDLINSTNGELISQYPTLEEVLLAIKKNIGLKMRVWNLDLTSGEYSWEALGKKLYK